MTVFLVATIKPENDEILAEKIPQSFPSNYYEVGRGQWLVAFSGTAKELYLKLAPQYSRDKVEETSIPSTMVISFAGYWGVMSRDLWDWVATKLQSGNA